MKTILLTGATGFLGSHLLRKLVESKYCVLAVKRSSSNTARIEALSGRFTPFDADKHGIEAAFEREGIAAVVHAATVYGRKGEALSEMVESNIVFPLKLLELSIEHGVSAFINTDTILPPTVGNYASTKNDFVKYVRMLCNGRIRFVNMKVEQMYGPGDDETKFIPFILNAMASGKKSIDLTKGEQQRGFVHVDDVVRAFLSVLSHVDEMEKGITELEVGSGESYKIKDVVLLAKKLMKSDIALNFGAIPYRKNEVMKSRTNNKAMEKLGWKPEVGLEHGLKGVIGTLEKNKRGGKRG